MKLRHLYFKRAHLFYTPSAQQDPKMGGNKTQPNHSLITANFIHPVKLWPYPGNTLGLNCYEALGSYRRSPAILC